MTGEAQRRIDAALGELTRAPSAAELTAAADTWERLAGRPPAADIPRSYRAFPPEASTITIQTPGAPARYAADVATAQQHIRWHDGTHIRDIDYAVREVLLQLAEHLTATGRVADAEADLTPTIVVRLDVKTWPAIPGITTPAEEHP
jgi:hypothetical protein